jgi:hypothetical protein
MLETLAKELTPFEQRLFTVALKSKGDCKYAIKSAIRHIERALILADDMPEVAAFLAMTAEEEMVTALFHLLKQKRFDNANKLKHRDHQHKQGVYPFIQLFLEAAFESLLGEQIRLRFDGNDVLWLDIPLASLGSDVLDKDGNQLVISPTPPLSCLCVGSDGQKQRFEIPIQELAKTKNIENIRQHLKDIANQRNKVLYASSGKIPECKNVEQIVQQKIKVLVSIVITFLLIEPHQANKQILVQDGIDAFLTVLGQIQAGKA